MQFSSICMWTMHYLMMNCTLISILLVITLHSSFEIAYVGRLHFLWIHFKIVDRVSDICNKRENRPDKSEKSLPDCMIYKNFLWEILKNKRALWNLDFSFFFYCKSSVKTIVTDHVMFSFKFQEHSFDLYNSCQFNFS